MGRCTLHCIVYNTIHVCLGRLVRQFLIWNGLHSALIHEQKTESVHSSDGWARLCGMLKCD